MTKIKELIKDFTHALSFRSDTLNEQRCRG